MSVQSLWYRAWSTGVVALILFSVLASWATGCSASAEAWKPGLQLGLEAVSVGVIELPGLGAVSAIADGGCSQLEPGQRLVAGSRGAAIVEGERIVKEVRFADSIGAVEIRDVDADGVCELVNQGGGWQIVSLLSADGQERWRYGRGLPAVDVMKAADLDGDGRFEFVVGMNGGGGLRALDREGQLLWKLPAANVFDVEILDAHASPGLEIVHSDARRGIVTRTLSGDLLTELPSKPTGFTVLRSSQGSPRLVTFALSKKGVDTIVIRDLRGAVETQFDLPDRGHLSAQVALVPWEDQPVYAVSRTLVARRERSAFYLVSQRGEVLHHELFEAPYTNLLAVEDADQLPELWVGTKDRVLVYRRR